MRVQFLIGPSGSGKTHQCLERASSLLRENPTGPPLLFLAPKQATFQIEREILSRGVQGYSRLQILSFERLATFIIAHTEGPLQKVLDVQGRLAILRALLTREAPRLKVFHASGSLPGFTMELSAVIDELEQADVGSDCLIQIAATLEADYELSGKLTDLAHLIKEYFSWLKRLDLLDAGQLLKVAQDRVTGSGLSLEEFWLDGFAGLSERETELLCAVLPHCQQATLAFNCDPDCQDPESWLSHWNVPFTQMERLKKRLLELAIVQVNTLPRREDRGRFAKAPALAHLEEYWGAERPWTGADAEKAVRLVQCPNPEAEAIQVAREIIAHVRNGGRYRDIAVIVRDLEPYQSTLQRIFGRYEIPYFMDRRTPAAHHPLCEVSRSALRLIARGWQNEDWFSALKTGLCPASEEEVDFLENGALRFGITGTAWRSALVGGTESNGRAPFEPIREKLARPFLNLEKSLGKDPTGEEFAKALRSFWDELKIEEKLESWQNTFSEDVHFTLLEQLERGLDDLTLAFKDQRLGLSHWLDIFETLLSSQTVGVIPPAIDQVLIGAIDRSRNPRLEKVIVVGMNDQVFPRQIQPGGMLTENDRERLRSLGLEIPAGHRVKLAEERYLGYIAFTRASSQLIVLWSKQSQDEKDLLPSPFVEQIRKIFPTLTVEEFDAETRIHPSDLWPALLDGAALSSPAPFQPITLFKAFEDRCDRFRLSRLSPSLSPETAAKLYRQPLETSTSQIEEFAKCQFKFFVHAGLKAKERLRLELDSRERGTFQHEVLSRFHARLKAEEKKWRDLTPDKAVKLIGDIGEELIPTFHDGLLQISARARFEAEQLLEALQEFMRTAIKWMQHYQFDPVGVELEFGLGKNHLPAWRIDLGEGRTLFFRGKIDRVDLIGIPGKNEAYCVVLDYKSSGRQLDALLLEHGMQIQLLGYLGTLQQTAGVLGFKKLHPAGVFYVPLKDEKILSAKNRSKALQIEPEDVEARFQHRGRFARELMELFDSRPDHPKGTQFYYKRNTDGGLHRTLNEAVDAGWFMERLSHIENHLRAMGQRIYEGEIAPNPFQVKAVIACKECDYAGICRIDPATHAFRILTSAS